MGGGAERTIRYAERVIARSHPVFYSVEEYLTLEESSNVRHEYLDGQIYAMAGGTPEHAALCTSLATHLSNAVRGGRCRVHGADLRIRVSATGLMTYPDVSVTCGPWERAPEDGRSVTNPVLLAEVLSKSTEAYDRGEKLEHYQRIPSLRACWLVAQKERQLELWSRPAEDAIWQPRVFRSGEAVVLEALGVTLEVDAIYEDAAEPV